MADHPNKPCSHQRAIRRVAAKKCLKVTASVKAVIKSKFRNRTLVVDTGELRLAERLGLLSNGKIQLS